MTEVMSEHGRVVCAADLAVGVACKPWRVVCFLETDLVQFLASLSVHQVSKMDMLTKQPVMLGIISSSVATKPSLRVGIRQNINQLSWGMGSGPSGSTDGSI